jgi:hypothetical protein
MVATKPARIKALLGAPAGEPLGPQGGDQDADGRRGEDDAGLDGVVAANGLEEDRDHEGGPQQQQPLDVLGDQAEVGGAVAEQPGGQQRFLPGPLPGPDVEEEPAQEAGPRASSTTISGRLSPACRIPTTTNSIPTADRTAPTVSKGRVGSAGKGSTSLRLSSTITTMTASGTRTRPAS